MIILLFLLSLGFRKNIAFWTFPGLDGLFFWLRATLGDDEYRARNINDRLEPKYWDKNILQSHIMSTTYPSWNIFETSPGLRCQRSANIPLRHGTDSLAVRVHWLLKSVSTYHTVNTLHIGYNKEPAIDV